MKNIFFLLVLFLNVQILMSKPIDLQYTVSIPEPHTHYATVTMEFDNSDKEYFVELKMAVWTPGSYLVREFSKSIENFTASDNKGNQLEFNKTRKNVWRVETNGAKKIKISYDVYAFELTVRTSFIDADMAYMNGTSVFMWVEGHQNEQVTIDYDVPSDWKNISTGLKKKGSEWTRTAPNYDILVDSPVAIGNHDVYEFTAQGIPHKIAMVGEGNYNIEQIKTDFIKIADVCTEMYKENPLDEYTYIVLSTESSYGGLEHLNSTSLIYPRWNYQPFSKYVRFVSLALHEYFHLWNVKRARPIALGPFDYENETYTTLLWVAEGFTSYYDEYLLQRAGIINTDGYFGMLESVFNTLESQEGRKVQSLSEASFDAWIKFYRKNENTNNCCISYYGKGAIISFMLDAEIRSSSKGKYSLDDVMRFLYNEYYKKQERGFTEQEVQAAMEKYAGKSMQQFFDDYINGTKEIDYDKFLGVYGLRAVNTNAGASPFLGCGTNYDDGRLTISRLTRDAAAYKAGLNVNDEIIAIDGYRVIDEIGSPLKRYDAGDTVTFTISRGGKLRTFDITLGTNPNKRLRIEKVSSATEEQKARYKEWLNESF